MNANNKQTNNGRDRLRFVCIYNKKEVIKTNLYSDRIQFPSTIFPQSDLYIYFQEEQLTFIIVSLCSQEAKRYYYFSLLYLVYHLCFVRSFLNRSYEEVAVPFVKPYNGLRLESSYVCVSAKNRERKRDEEKQKVLVRIGLQRFLYTTTRNVISSKLDPLYCCERFRVEEHYIS